LAQHLLTAYPEAAIGDVVGELRSARDAVSNKGLDDAEQLEVAELIVRHQLMMLTGRPPFTGR